MISTKIMNIASSCATPCVRVCCSHSAEQRTLFNGPRDMARNLRIPLKTHPSGQGPGPCRCRTHPVRLLCWFLRLLRWPLRFSRKMSLLQRTTFREQFTWNKKTPIPIFLHPIDSPPHCLPCKPQNGIGNAVPESTQTHPWLTSRHL